MHIILARCFLTVKIPKHIPLTSNTVLTLQQVKKTSTILLIVLFIAAYAPAASAQCSVCTKSVQQLGEKPAKALNSGIMYLMLTPFLIVGVIGYRWWKSNKRFEEEEGRAGQDVRL